MKLWMEVNINARRNVTDCIEIRPWQVLGTYGQRKYLYKTWFSEASYEILITDGLKIWQENLDESSFVQKCKVRSYSFCFLSCTSLNLFILKICNWHIILKFLLLLLLLSVICSILTIKCFQKIIEYFLKERSCFYSSR